MKIIGITGGKGGTGKSTVATALAVELGKKSKVLLADMDADCPNDHLLLNIERKHLATAFQRIPKWDMNKCTRCGACAAACKTNAIICTKGNTPIFMQSQCNGCGACKITCPAGAISWDKKPVGTIYEGASYGIDLLSSELKINEPVSEIVVGKAAEIIEKRKKEYDFILVDTAAGTHCDVISALGICDTAMCVTEPTPLGLHDLELIMELLTRLKTPFEIVLNRYENNHNSQVSTAISKYNKTLLAKIPYKKEIMLAYSKGIPIKEKSIQKIAKWVETL
ncbi:MAG: ATP-binding protein [archaeon]|nr:ATP-binding protein [archaeon]